MAKYKLGIQKGKLIKISTESKLTEEEKKKRHSLLVQKSQKKYPQKHSARRKIRLLIKRGELPPASLFPCADCGKPAQEYDHARGYVGKNGGYVEAICKKCHVKRGRVRGEFKNAS